MRRALTLCIAPLAFASPVAARTWQILPDGTGDAPTIQAGVDLAADGDILELGDGTFRGSGNRDVDLLGKQLVIRSASDDPLLCVIDVEGTEADPHRAFRMRTPSAGARLRSLTLTGGHVIGGVTTGHGGAVHCGASSRYDFENMRFQGNTAAGGGAVRADEGAVVRFDDCVFVENRVVGSSFPNNGGAVLTWDAGSATFTNCHFIGQTASGGGGALFDRGGSITITDCVFEANVASRYGGGAVLASNSTEYMAVKHCEFLRNRSLVGTSPHGGALAAYRAAELTDCLFVENDAYGDGGAVNLEFPDAGPATVRNCIFLRNEGGQGGALSVKSGTQATIEGCRFEENVAHAVSGRGGALRVYTDARAEVRESTFLRNFAVNQGGAVSVLSELPTVVESCTFVENEAATGGGAYFEYPGSVIRRTILSFSTYGGGLAGQVGAEPTVGCSDIFGNAGGDALFGIDDGGNFSADPFFCDRENGDFKIQAYSPCAPPGVTGCGLVGALPVGCGSVAVESSSWARVKSYYR